VGGLVRLLFYLFRSIGTWLASYGARKWATADAIVTEDPVRVAGFPDSTVEIVYSYRVGGELYAGLHEEPAFMGSGSEYMERFPKGRNFVVRVKPGEPEVSVVRDDDQGDGIRKRLEPIDDSHRSRLENKPE
jgi:hypothetical protein